MNRLHPLLLCLAGSAACVAAEPVELHSRHREHRVLVASAEQADWRYLAFPALLDLGDQVLLSYKRAQAHARDPGATLELARLDPTSGRVTGGQTIARLDNHIMQMGEWVRFSNGDIANYIDAQGPGKNTTRIGLRVVRSTDGGKTFGPLERVGAIDGVEYGYAFDAIVNDKTTWMLVMTFSSLPGGKAVVPSRPHAGSVDVIRSDDHGRTWRFVRNLSREFGDISINESAFVRHGDGFLVSTRGYDNRQRLHLTDGSFHLLRQTDLTGLHPFIRSYVGRPRLFERDGRVYLLGRNVSAPGRPMQLALFRLDPVTLTVAAYAILDNAENVKVTDGYYAVPYFREVGGRTLLHVVTYKGVNSQPPDIVQFDFRWDEVK
jgi:hypothetical protein